MHLKICTSKISIWVLIVGVVLLVLSIVLAFVVFPIVLRKEIAKSTRLEEGTSQWNRFVELPFPLKFKANLFVVTNAEEVVTGSKPVLQEIGPYTYNQKRVKENITFNEEDDTVSFYQYQYYEFNADESGEGVSESDQITFLNVPYLTLIQTTENLPSSFPLDVESALQEVFVSPTLFFQATAKQVIFDGVQFCDPSRLNSLSSKVLCLAVLVMNLRNLDYQEDGSAKFSLFYYKWNKHDGYYTMKRGMDDIDDLGKIVSWNGFEYTTYWGDEQNSCNQIDGYDSTIYPPYNDKDRVFDIFSTDIYRKMPVTYLNEMTYEDIPGYRYGADESTFHEEVPEESCYCLNRTKNVLGQTSCFLDGTMDMYSALRVPALISLPHFLYANKAYLEAVDGLNPSEEEHLTYVELEPNTGTPLTGRKRFQVNFVVRPIEGISSSANWPRTVLPAVWLDEGMELTDEYVDELNDLYFKNVKILDGVKWALISLFAVVTVVSAGFVAYNIKAKKQSV